MTVYDFYFFIFYIYIVTCIFIVEIVLVSLILSKFYNLYQGTFRVCWTCMWFLVFNERCTPRDVSLPFVPCLFNFKIIQHVIIQ